MIEETKKIDVTKLGRIELLNAIRPYADVAMYSGITKVNLPTLRAILTFYQEGGSNFMEQIEQLFPLKIVRENIEPGKKFIIANK